MVESICNVLIGEMLNSLKIMLIIKVSMKEINVNRIVIYKLCNNCF